MHKTSVYEKNRPEQINGPYLARVISNLDPTYTGILKVELLKDIGNSQSESQTHLVRMISPFLGNTHIRYVTNNNDYGSTQKSYGMWMVPPDVGTIVVVMFMQNDTKYGYYVGSVVQEGGNFMLPGLAATTFNVEQTYPRAPVGEYNKIVNQQVADPTTVNKPTHPFADVLNAQGLIKDDIRGITTSSARRESPSMVFGISTPGPLDKTPGAPKGSVGTAEYSAPQFVSRLGGTTFVMDDGDDKFLRKGPASSTPPDYAAIENDDPVPADPTIPHNELVRIRTRTGHQILLHNSEDLIYIGNARGTTWIELTSNGKIDIYANDSVSVHTKNDFNVTADRDINLTAGNNVNINAGQNIFATATAANVEIKAGADGKITVGGSLNLTSSHHIETAGTIDMNGPTAATATDALKAARIPEMEPWPGHENLDPANLTPAPQATATPTQPAPAAFGQYTTIIDTFSKTAGPNSSQPNGGQ